MNSIFIFRNIFQKPLCEEGRCLLLLRSPFLLVPSSEFPLRLRSLSGGEPDAARGQRFSSLCRWSLAVSSIHRVLGVQQVVAMWSVEMYQGTLCSLFH